jgi:hypothetical protein
MLGNTYRDRDFMNGIQEVGGSTPLGSTSLPDRVEAMSLTA